MNISTIMNTSLQFKVHGNMRHLYATPMPLWSLIKGIQENAALSELTAQGRALTSAEEFKAWKPRNLMSVYLAVRFKRPEGGAEAENVAGYTGLAGFDFDDVDVANVLEALKTVPQVVCAGVSASGKGVWCAARVTAATANEYLLCFAAGVAAFRERCFSGLDVGAHDPTRARFAASSPECWWRWWATEDIPPFEPTGDISLLSAGKKGGKKRVKLPAGYHQTPELAFDEVRQVLANADDIPDGERNTEKAREIGVLKSIAAKAGVAPDTYAQAFIDKWDSVGSNPKKTRSMVNRLMRGKNSH